MEKIINIDGRDVKLKTNGGFLLAYKAAYKRDAFKDILTLLKGMDFDSDMDKINPFDIIDNLDLEIFYNLVYLMARTGNPDIKVDKEAWFESFDSFPILDVLEDIITLLVESVSSSLASKKNKMVMTAGALNNAI